MWRWCKKRDMERQSQSRKEERLTMEDRTSLIGVSVRSMSHVHIPTLPSYMSSLSLFLHVFSLSLLTCFLSLFLRILTPYPLLPFLGSNSIYTVCSSEKEKEMDRRGCKNGDRERERERRKEIVSEERFSFERECDRSTCMYHWTLLVFHPSLSPSSHSSLSVGFLLLLLSSQLHFTKVIFFSFYSYVI